MTVSNPPTPNPPPPSRDAPQPKSEPQLQLQTQSQTQSQAQTPPPPQQQQQQPQQALQPPQVAHALPHVPHQPQPHVKLQPQTQPQTPQAVPKTEAVLPSTPTTPGPLSPLSASKKLKGGRRVVNPHLTDEQRRRERVLKNRESAMKSLQKKKRYTEDLEHRAVALASRNRELRDKIRLLLARLQQMGIVAVPGVGVVFSPSAAQAPYANVQTSPAPAQATTASAPIVPPDWSVDFSTPAPVSATSGPAVSAPDLQIPETLQTPAEVATPTATSLPQEDISAIINQSLPIVGTPPTSPALALQQDLFSLPESESKLGVFDIPHMTCQ